MKSPIAVAGAAALALLGACATSAPTPYGPAGAGGYGYAETRVESDRYIVTFSGNSSTTAGQAEGYALRRAAELTLQEGYDWFRVARRGAVQETKASSSGPNVSVGVGGAWGSGGRSSTGVGIGIGFPGGGSYDRAPSASRVEVVLGKGAKPAGEADAYDARAVLAASSG